MLAGFYGVTVWRPIAVGVLALTLALVPIDAGRPVWCRPWRFPGPVRAVYEAGPTGFGLARAARAAGIEVMVWSPGAIPRQPGDRIKTDMRDALKLARLHAAGQLRSVAAGRDRPRRSVGARRVGRVPGPSRGPARAPRPPRRADRRAGPGRAVGRVGQAAALHARHRQADRGRADRRDRRLQRVCHPRQLASFLGLVPSESSTGDKRRQGSITKAGSSHTRRLLIDAAWHYRRRPAISLTLRRRQQGKSAAAIQAAWRAQLRPSACWAPPHQAPHRPRSLPSPASWPASSGRSPNSPTKPNQHPARGGGGGRRRRTGPAMPL